MQQLKDFHILDLSKGNFSKPNGFYFAFPGEDGSLDDMKGPYPTRYAAVLAAVEFTADVYLATEEQGN